jgi:hypothetical protein
MTPQQFHDSFRATADEVSNGTGIDPIALLAQWACETDWGNVVVGNNLGNIRCSSTSFCRYATLGDFAVACIATWHNGFYPSVLASDNTTDQLAAICASPWDAGHYGGSLAAFDAPLEDFELTPGEHYALVDTQNKVINTLMPAVAALKAELDALTAKVATLSTPPAANVSVDFTPITALITSLQADVKDIKTHVDADLK